MVLAVVIMIYLFCVCVQRELYFHFFNGKDIANPVVKQPVSCSLLILRAFGLLKQSLFEKAQHSGGKKTCVY